MVWRRFIAGGMILVAFLLRAAGLLAQESAAKPDLDALVERLEAAEQRIRELEALSPATIRPPLRKSPGEFVVDPAGFSDADLFPSDAQGDDGTAELRSTFDDFRSGLERRLIKLEENYEKAKAADKKKQETAAAKPLVLWTGQVQTDFVWFGQSQKNMAAVGEMQDGADFRRARLGAYGEFLENVEYRLEYDFAFVERPAFLDNWVGFRAVPILGTVKVGRYFEPFGLERITSNRFTTFMERADGDQAFDPARKNGICFYNNNENGTVTWAAGIFRSFTDNFGDNVATQGAWAGTARLTWLPWYDEASGGRYYMHLGSGYSYRAAGEESVTFRAQPEIRMRDSSFPLNVPFFVNTGVIPADHWQLIGGEFALVLDSFSIQSEYVYVPVSRINGPNPAFQSAYAYCSYFLTGEYRPFQKMDSMFQRRTAVFDRVIPDTNVLPGSNSPGKPKGIGAWEVAFRWSYIDLNDQGILGGKMHELTAGLNWYLNPYTRVTWNYVKPFLDSPKNGDSSADIYGMRFGFDF